MPAGGKRPNSGRKAKAEEVQLIERLSPMADAAFAALKAGVVKKDFQYVKMFLEYYAGKPKESVNLNHTGQIGIVWQEIKNYGADDKTDESI